MQQLHSPWAFALSALIVTALLLHLRPRRRAALRFSSVDTVKGLSPSPFYYLRHVPPVLRCAVLVFLVVAIARPRKGTERVVEHTEGVAIEMVIDRSGSMTQGMKYRGERLNRFEVVKRVFGEFILGNDRGLKGRPNDLIGMVAFARYPDAICPLIHDHETLLQFVKATKLVRLRSEDGTGIGDAIALAAACLQTVEEELKRKGAAEGRQAFTIKSKAIVLLTDGENNTGRTPYQAAQLAEKWGIRIYCVGIVGKRMGSWSDLFGAGRSNLDDTELRSIAELTGGFYEKATDEDSLRRICERIDNLERTEIASERYLDYRERFAPWALAALCMLVLEVALAQTVFRRIP